jgi:hypothetical protein
LAIRPRRIGNLGESGRINPRAVTLVLCCLHRNRVDRVALDCVRAAAPRADCTKQKASTHNDGQGGVRANLIAADSQLLLGLRPSTRHRVQACTPKVYRASSAR